MRNIGLADKWRLSLIAISGLLAGCNPANEENFLVVAVKSRPQEAYDTLGSTYGCTASVIHNIPATRYFKSGRQQEYIITGVIGYKDICK